MPIPPIALTALAVAWIASLAAVGAWQRHDGRTAERAEWQARESEQLRHAHAAITRLTAAARAAEARNASALATISTRHTQELHHAQAQRTRDRADLRAGTLRLRDPGAPGLRADGCLPPAPGPAAGGRDARTPGDLSREAAEFLLDLAAEADDTARQLAACQRVVIADREMTP